MRIAMLTGGGDVPGLNPCIKALVTGAARKAWEVLGFRCGWAGPLNYDPDNKSEQSRWLEPLTLQKVRTIDRTGGTVLHTSRTNPRRIRPDEVPASLAGTLPDGPEPGTKDGTAHILRVLEALAIDALVPIGGDDTLSYAAHLARQGVPVVAIPKTMDNDVHGTDYCIGFSTAVTRSVEFIQALRTPAGSHERIAVIELFGRNSGETALVSGYLSDADRVVISEVPCNIDRLAELVMADRNENPSHYAVVVIAEGARLSGGEAIEGGERDAYGHLKLGGIGYVLAEELKARTGVATMNQQLAYLMRSGAPDSLDRMVAVTFGNLAVQQLQERATGVMLALCGGSYGTVPIETCASSTKRVNVAELYDPSQYKPRIRHVLGKPMFLY
jgi:6-phosphofructokinase 1